MPTDKTTDNSHSFESYFKRAASPLAVLCLLRSHPMYGYELSQAMKQASDGRFTISVLYPVLYRLEHQGYVYVDRTEIINNRARNYYAVTDEGRRHLEKCLSEYDEMDKAFRAILNAKTE